MLSKLASPYTIRGLMQRPELYPLAAFIGGASAMAVSYTSWCLLGKSDVVVNRWRGVAPYELESSKRRGQPFFTRDPEKGNDPAANEREKLLKEIYNKSQ